MAKHGIYFEYNNIIWNVDPHSKFISKGYAPQDVVNMLGIIPSFIVDKKDVDVIQHALDRYTFGGPPMGGTIEHGVYKYPNDPDLYPLTSCIAGGKMIFVYEYGIIAFVDIKTKESVAYRFD